MELHDTMRSVRSMCSVRCMRCTRSMSSICSMSSMSAMCSMCSVCSIRSMSFIRSMRPVRSVRHSCEKLAVINLQRGPPIADNKSPTHRTHRAHMEIYAYRNRCFPSGTVATGNCSLLPCCVGFWRVLIVFRVKNKASSWAFLGPSFWAVMALEGGNISYV